MEKDPGRMLNAALAATACLAGALLLFFYTVAVGAGEYIPRDAYKYQRDLIRNARVVWGLDAPVATFAAQIHQESLWRPDARSPFAAGLAQFTPSTATWIAGVYPESLGAAQPYSPAWALRALVTYDKHLWDRTSGADSCERFAFTLSAYNGGAGWVARDKRLTASSGSDPSRWFGHVEKFNAGRAGWAFKENRGYPSRILLKLQPLYEMWGIATDCTGRFYVGH